jgi:hypothetical protein
MTESEAYVTEYKADNASEVAHVTTFIDAFGAWYAESQLTTPTDLAAKETTYKNAQKDLADNVDVDKLKASVIDKAAYIKLRDEKIDGAD